MEKSITVKQSDFGKLCIFATRYCHSTHYIPKKIHDILEPLISELSDEDLEQLKADIIVYEEFGQMHKTIRTDWLHWVQIVNSEAERRANVTGA